MPVPKSFSASALQTFDCPSRWVAEWYAKAPDTNNSAAALGSACHGALDYFVGTVDMHKLAKWYPNTDPKYKQQYVAYMRSLFEDEYERLFGDDRSRFDEGMGLLVKWLDRQDAAAWTPERTVLSREVKTSFPLKTTAGEIPFNYIWDRCDRIELLDADGEPTGEYEVEVVDYKTTALPLNPQSLRAKLQARMYGVAASIQYPEAKRVWVTFDQLRHDPVSIVFTREENVEAWKFLKRRAEDIIAAPDGTEQATDEETGEPAVDDDGQPIMILPAERINSECRWCIRKAECDTLFRHEEAGGPLKVSTVEEAAARIADIDDRIGALRTLRGELEPVILHHIEETEQPEFVAEGVEVVLSGRRQRDIDKERARAVAGADVVAKYGAIGVTVIDKIVKDPDVPADVKAKLTGLITYVTKEPTVKVKRQSAVERDD